MKIEEHILPFDEALFDIKEFHLEKLNNNDISSIANKDDVEKVLNGVLAHFDIKEMNIFEKLLKHIDIATYFEEWNSMIRKIGI